MSKAMVMQIIFLISCAVLGSVFILGLLSLLGQI